MDPWKGMLGAAWVPLLSGCMMMGGMAHTGGGAISAAGPPGDMHRRDLSGRFQQAEARSGDLAISLSFASPIESSRALPIDAWLSRDGDHRDLADGVVWLQIQAPDGGVDRVLMQRLPSSSGGTYRALYHFSSPGLYLVTAEGRTGTGADMRTVSVTTEAGVESWPAGGHGWVMPLAVIGGVGMVVLMAFMMAS